MTYKLLLKNVPTRITQVLITCLSILIHVSTFVLFSFKQSKRTVSSYMFTTKAIPTLPTFTIYIILLLIILCMYIDQYDALFYVHKTH